MFPKGDTDRLAGEDGYLVWALRMQNAFEYCGLLDIVDGKITRPSPGDTTEAVWLKMNAAAHAFMIQCINSNLVMKNSEGDLGPSGVRVLTTSGSGSIIYWFSRLTHHMSPTGNVSEHITSFQEAVRYLANADFTISESVTAAILLSTLPNDPKDPVSWDYFIKGIKITKTTTLSSVISQILEEKRRQTSASTSHSAETALAALEWNARAASKKWCRNCKSDGHDWSDCWATGGGKEGQGPKRKRKKKVKEKANVADEEKGESANVVTERCLVSNETYFSDYASVISESTPTASPPTPHDVMDSVYSAHTMSSLTPIIDSGASSHIFPDRSTFHTYNHSSGSVNGFGDSSSSISGHGEAQVLTIVPNGSKSCLTLRDACHVPTSSTSIISVPQLDDAYCYTLFGNGQCITFKLEDGGKLLQDMKTRYDIVLTGTKRADRLYYLDTPRRQSETILVMKATPLSKLEKLHRRLGHLNYDSIRTLVRKGLVTGLKLTKEELNFEPPLCPACAMGKLTRASFPLSEGGRASQLLGLVHSDLWGPAPVQTMSGSRYLMTIIDNYSRWVWVYFLQRKSDAFASFKDWKGQAEKSCGRVVAWRHLNLTLGLAP